jgi:MFS family permease
MNEITPMVKRAPRFLLALASLLSALGGAIHAAAFRKALAAIDASDIPKFYASTSKGLWLADSATLFILAALFGLLAARPSTGRRPLVILTALIPAATAILLYTFLGNFFAGHLLLVIAGLAFLAGLQFPASEKSVSASIPKKFDN